jgi:hypothetical protein
MTCDVTRTELLIALAELSEQHPDWRLGQTIANLAWPPAAPRPAPLGTWKTPKPSPPHSGYSIAIGNRS